MTYDKPLKYGETKPDDLFRLQEHEWRRTKAWTLAGVVTIGSNTCGSAANPLEIALEKI
jgi:hypothetical protein